LCNGKTYSTDMSEGARLWAEVEARLEHYNIVAKSFVTDSAAKERYGREHLVQPRLGQGAFRVLVTEAYSRKCAITGEKTLPVLDASHIKPYSKGGPHAVSNGLLLRQDLHTLFDRGYMTITEDYKIVVSKRIKEDYGNGREYYRMHGKPLLVLPRSELKFPSKEFINWHNENVYVS
jgi:putative restriction endonuclease